MTVIFHMTTTQINREEYAGHQNSVIVKGRVGFLQINRLADWRSGCNGSDVIVGATGGSIFGYNVA